MRAIILAGGKGTRLKPYTTFIPKPLVPIGNEMPILEILIHQLAKYGFKHITITVNHLAHLIMAYFNDGAKWNVKIDYSIEDKDNPLSTIGPLTLIKDLPENFLVINGDLVCNMNYKEFYDYHVTNNHKVTVAVQQRGTKVNFGVLNYDENNTINQFIEKPVYMYHVSMGINCINRSVIEKIEKNVKYGFDDLILDGLRNNEGYKVYNFKNLWIDVGIPEEYDYCNENFDEIKIKLGL